MTREQEVKIVRGIVDKRGERAQIIKAVEEMSELTHALCRYIGEEKPKAADIVNACEEIADVEIMLEQMKIIFDAGQVMAWKRDKLSRLAALLET